MCRCSEGVVLLVMSWSEAHRLVLQISRGKRYDLGDNFPYCSFLMYVANPPLEPSHRDSSNEESQHMFLLRNKKNYL